MTIIWKVSRGSGGFHATHESVQVRGEPGDWSIVFTTPIGVNDLYDSIEDPEDAIQRARLEALERGFDRGEFEGAEQ